MKTLTLSCCVLCMAAFVLSACGGTQIPNTPAAFRATTGGTIRARAASDSALAALPLRRVSPATIVYTPANVRIDNSSYNLSLKNDGMTDFVIKSFTYSRVSGCGYYNKYGSLSVDAPGSNGVETDNGWVAVLLSGSRIGPLQTFSNGIQDMLTFDYIWQKIGMTCAPKLTINGPWNGVGSAFVGLAFVRNGKTHYGWAQFDGTYVDCYGDCRGDVVTFLKGYAYQTIPDRPIKAGQM